MAFFRQLKLLLWKNWLAVIRQPLWSLTLVAWPLIIFIIIAVTRNQFPPVQKDICYVGPRNLPSTGFFPFLQTLMCNTDSNCHNKSRLVDPAASKSTSRSKKQKSSPLSKLVNGDELLNFLLPKGVGSDPAALFEVLNNFFGSSHQGSSNNASFMNTMNNTLPPDQESLNQMLESVNLLKRAICSLTLPMINTSSPDSISYAVVTFCTSNNTLFEVSLNTINEILTQLMMKEPDEMMTLAGVAVLVFDKLQSQTPLWDTLLAIPQLLNSGSIDQGLDSAEVLLSNLQGSLHVIESNFPEAGASLSTVHPLLAGGINLINYAQNWPGRDVSIPLGEIVTLQNDTLSEMVKTLLQNIKIPLDKAIGLALDSSMASSYLCDNSSNPMWLTAACRTGTVDMLLGWISPDKLAKQALLVWSKHVAPHDVSYAKGLLHSLMGTLSQGGQGVSSNPRSSRSVETQPQNIEEELFLGVGQVVMEIIKSVPELDMVLQSILGTGFQSMNFASLSLENVEEIIANVMKDADKLQMAYLTILQDQTEASAWISQVVDSVMKVIMKILSSESLKCEDVFGPFEWLLKSESIKTEVWRSMICQNSSALQEALLVDWLPLVQKAQDLYGVLTGQTHYNVTLPMILSEWHRLYNNSLQLGVLFDRLATELGGAYWMNWMPDNSTPDVTGILQQSAFFIMVNVGENIEKSQLWPDVKDYFHMLYWISNYRPGLPTQPPNCSMSYYGALQCDTGLKWPQFVQTLTRNLMSPNQDVLVNFLKGTVNLLQHVYGDTYKNLAGSFLKQEIIGGDALSAYLTNLLENLDVFVNTISMLPDRNITNPNVMLPLLGNLLQSTGLKPLLPLFLSDGPLNASAVLDVASKLGRLNQHIFTFNETDPTMPELERLIMQFLSLEGNLTMSLPHIMGHTLLTYSDYFNPDDVARLRKAIQPFTNQTSAGFVEAILRAMELLKKVLDAPDGDPTNIILGYIRQLQDFVMSLYRLRKIQHLPSSSGNLSTAQVTDLHMLSKDFLSLLTPEGLMNLTQAGQDAAQDIVAQKFIAFLPKEVQQEAARFLKDFKALQYHIIQCAEGQNCLTGVSEIFMFLDQILDLMLSADGNVKFTLSSTNSVLKRQEDEEIATLFFSLLLSSDDAAYMETFKQFLHFIRLIIATPNISVSDVQNALQQSNLTLEELNNIAALAGAANINDLMVDIMELIKVRQCFEPQDNPMVTAQCVMGLINGVSSFLSNVPVLRNETAVLSLIPLIVNNSIMDVLQVDSSSNPQMAIAHTLNSILANIKMNLQQNQLSTPEIMKEIMVVEGLIQLIAISEPFDNLNTTLMMEPLYAQKVYLQIVEWYLKKLENITSTSSVSGLVDPFFSLTHMQVTLQLAQVDYSLFLMNNLQNPIDAAGVGQIGQTTVELLRHLFELIMVNLETQNNIPGTEPFFNTTILHVTKLQVRQYLSLIQRWMKQPNVPLVIESMLQWASPSINISTPMTNLHQLLETIVNFVSADQRAYLAMIRNITQSLSKALMVAEKPGGLQSEQFSAAILEVVRSALNILSAATGPLPPSVQQNILEIVQDSLKLIVQPEMSIASSRNISLLILKKAESLIKVIIPQPFAEYVLAGVELVTTYFESISAATGPNSLNQLILDEMESVQSLLPPNCTAQPYISVLINITHFILESGQGNMSLWGFFESASLENMPIMFGQSEQLSAAILFAVRSALNILSAATGPLPPSVQQNILEIVQDSLKLIVQPEMSIASSRNISLLILKKAESLIKVIIPQPFAEYVLAGVELVTTYFESISSATGPNSLNQLILDEMESVQSLLPPNCTAQPYISVLINITHFILESGQGNMSLWGFFESASLENMPIMFGQSEQFSAAILFAIRSALNILSAATGPLPPSVQQNILEIVQDSLKLIVQPEMSIASSRNISLLILKKAESLIKVIIPQPFAEYVLAGVKLVTTYFESISSATGPNSLNQLILDEMESVQSLLPPNCTAQPYISVLINITHFILESGQGNMSLWGFFESASLENMPIMFGQSEQFSAAILFAIRSALNILSAATGPLPPSVQQNILEIVQDSLKLIVQPEMSIASSRNISLLILKKAESLIKVIIPQPFAEYVLAGVKLVTTYFESISSATGPNSLNQLILDEMESVQSLLPPNCTAQPYISVLINITHFILESGQGNMSLWGFFESASLENMPIMFGQSEQFSAAILFAVRSALNILSAATGPLPPSVQQNILEIVQDSLKLIVQPEMSIASSRNISLLILKKAESLIKVIIPQPFAEYVLAGVKLVTTYFESISAATGPNSLNQLILDEMEAVQSLLPPNSPAQPYISVLINITHFILESGQGNMSLWASFESASEENVSIIFGQLGKLLSTLWPGIMGGQGLHTTAPSLEGFVHLAPVLQEVMTGKADKETWDKLEKLLESLLSTLKGTELWDGTPSVIPQFEKIIRSLVNTVQAQNVMIQSLQMPVVTLMREIAQSVNSTHFNLSEISQRMQPAIEHTLELAEQANGTLKCSEVLIAWEPVREAAGLSPSIMSMWCNIHLQPVLEAYAEAQTVYALMNMSHMGVGPMTVSATAARIVKSVQSLYHANMNSTIVSQQLIMVIVNQLSGLTGQSLSPEAELYWYKQLQDVQLLNSLSSFKMLSDELVNAAPFIQPYTDALEGALNHILGNYDLFEDSSSSEDIFREAAMIFLSSANITLDNSMMSGNFSGLNVESLTNMIKEAVQQIIDLQIFGNEPMLYQALEQFLASNESSMIVQKVFDMVAWLASTKSSGFDLLTQVLPKIYDIVRPLLSVLTQLGLDMSENMELFEDLAGNIIAMLRQLVSTSGLLSPKDHRSSMYGMSGGNHTSRVRNRREAPSMMARDPMDDFIDLFYIDYPTMFKAISVPVSTNEILETVHVFFANPDMNVVVKGVTSDMSWGLNASREDTIDAALGLLSFVTLPSTFQMSSMDLLSNAAAMLPDGFPFSAMLKHITRVLAGESQENLMLMQETIQTAIELFQISLTDPRFTEQLSHLGSKVCAVEQTESVRLLMLSLSIEPGQLCNTILPSLQMLVESLMMNTSYLSDAIFQTAIGEPKAYNLNSNWSSLLSQGLGFNTSNLSSLDINITAPGVVTVGELLRNKTAFLVDVQKHMDFDPDALHLLMETILPNNNLEILSWLVNLRHCGSTEALEMKETDLEMLKTFCSLSVEQWYSFSMLMARHLNMEKLIYRMVLTEEMQGLVGVMLQMAEVITSMMKTFIPTIGHLQTFMVSVQDLNLGANHEFDQMARGHRSSISSKATFVTLSRALCSKGILALFGVSKLTTIMELNSSQSDQVKRGEMIKRFKIPQDASPFCMNMYLDMVNTTGGAIAWAFLKPMLMGHILYTPDTPATRAIMEKANSTLNEFANLRKYSEDWIESSNYLVKSAVLLSQTLPMLQNSLGNSFVQRFIEMQTDINVDTMKETLSNFSNITAMLEKNKHIMDQVTTLSTLMVNLSSCITFDRYRGYDTADELNAAAQHLAKNRDLYASVIFKLPKDTDASRKRNARASSSTSTLPPKVSYTIRMHMDNLMRTDRVRDPYFMKDHHISAQRTLRYNRGFVYLQENIDRAIIETQTGHRIEETAVQLQPFPYPCHYRDEYLEAIAFVFPLMLMIAWVLFVADFVKKLVHERELRLHEYMKMMGVNPLSHFFAWFLECASYLVLTVSILTLVLKYGDILPHSNGFILFLYLCNYSLSILSFSYLVSSFFDKTYIAGLSGSLLYILCFFPFIVVLAVETDLTFSQKSALSLFSPTCFSYASQYISRFESQGEGLQWSNSYTSPIPGDTSSFGWLCWLMLIDSILYFIIGGYIRMVFPGNYGIASPWYFPFKASFWADLCCCCRSNSKVGRGLLFTNIMQKNQPVFSDDKGKGQSSLSSQTGEDFSELPVGVALHGLSKMYGDRVAIQNLNVSFYEGHVTSLLGHNGAGKTTTMSLLTGLFAPTSGTIEVYGRDMQTNIDDIRRELGVCMQYDVLFDHMTTKEHLLLYGQIKAPHWSQEELREQVRSTLEETGMYAHRHKLVSTLSGGMKRKLSISIAFIGGSRLVVLDEPTAGVDPCSRRNIWDIVIQHKKQRTVIMSTHHLDEAEVLSDRIAFLERGGLKCCGSPLHLKDKLGQGYKLTLTKKVQNPESEPIDNADLKVFIQAHVPEARLKEAQGGDLVYSLPPFNSSNASSYRSLLTALDANLDALQLGGYGISDTTLEEVFLQLTHGNSEDGSEDGPLSISETVSDTDSIDSFPSDSSGNIDNFGDKIKLTGSSTMSGMALAWQQMTAILVKRFHHSRRDWKGLIAQILLPVLFMVFAMGLGSIRSDLRHYPELELSPALYNLGPSYSFFSNQNPNTSQLTDTMLSYPGIDNACLDKSNNPVCTRSASSWSSRGNGSKAFSVCKCSRQEQVCDLDNFQPPHKKIPSSQIVYNLSGINVEKYLVATANDFIRNRYGGFSFGESLPQDLKMDLTTVPKNRTLSKVWYNPEGHHTMPAYLNSLNNIILRSNLPADKDQREYAISVSSHPYFGRADDEDSIIQGMLQIMVAMCVLTGYSITTASFAIYEVSEHHSGSKRLQHISGISEPMYWTVNFFYDMVMYLIPVTLTVAVIAAFQIPAFTEQYNLGAVTLLLVLFGFATFPWMYLLSGIFKDAEMAFIAYVCINLFISINTIMSTSILYFLSQISSRNSEVIQEIFRRLSEAFLIFPQFNFGNGLMKLARMNIEVQLLSGYDIDAYKNPLSMDGLGWMFFSSFIEGVVFFALRLLLNRLLIRKVRNLIFGRKTVLQAPQAPQVSCETKDEDVVAEHQRVSSGAASTDVLQVNQLTKVYQQFNKKVPAVNKISVGIPAGECFGLLGVNGAGKTTTFKMLTGDVRPTDGTAQIRDRDGRLVDIMECRNEGINIGYCPQVDALDDLLTGKEHLYFYARIRGISNKEIDGVVNYLLKRLELSYHKDIITDGYSCGTRRKLSTALALIGHPKILLLDEPSSGMDPRTKRHLWKIISEEVKGKCAVVLTSHSMEECEALCSRLAIMVKGQFCCLGSLQHIKNRFGSGFTVKMYLAEASCDAEAITVFMRSRFPSTYLKDQHSTMVEYHVPTAPGGVADIFDQLESNKNALQIKHFSVSQTTLDEVFINFALGDIAMESISLNSEDGSDDLDSIKAVDI
ncbi:uncharacterized protein abca12 isoform X2 [Trematomus bernacchii]|uniref:uncharacterized protein abca12 isoform X2 n=1 Tax=Trematomus bernacchii TaxID=40690 RepID=UPI00146BA615|nr:uncharacterized protein abca12 isoform X2 [Trematomus bernacchii]